MKIDFNREYTEAEIEAIRTKLDESLRQMILATYIFTAGAVLSLYVYFKLTELLLK
jgi:hypothetical protein